MKNERLYNAIKTNNFNTFSTIMLKEILPQAGETTNVRRIDDEIASKLTALQTAVQFGRLEMVQWLMENGANVNAVVQGHPPRSMAIARGYTFIADFLWFCGATDGPQLLENSQESKREDNQENKKERKEEIRNKAAHKDNRKNTILHLESALISAVNSARTKVVTLLLQFIKRKELLAEVKPILDSLLDLAAANSSKKIIEELLNNGATMLTVHGRRSALYWHVKNYDINYTDLWFLNGSRDDHFNALYWLEIDKEHAKYQSLFKEAIKPNNLSADFSKYRIKRSKDNSLASHKKILGEENAIYYDFAAEKNSFGLEGCSEFGSFYKVLAYACAQHDYVALTVLFPEAIKSSSLRKEILQQQNFTLLNRVLFLGDNPELYLAEFIDEISQQSITNSSESQCETNEEKSNEEKRVTKTVLVKNNIVDVVAIFTQAAGSFAGVVYTLLQGYYHDDTLSFKKMLNCLVARIPLRKNKPNTMEDLAEDLQRVITEQFLLFFEEAEGVGSSSIANSRLPSLSLRAQEYIDETESKVTSIQKRKLLFSLKDYASTFAIKCNYMYTFYDQSENKKSRWDEMGQDTWLHALSFLSGQERAQVASTSYRFSRFIKNSLFTKLSSDRLLTLNKLHRQITVCLDFVNSEKDTYNLRMAEYQRILQQDKRLSTALLFLLFAGLASYFSYRLNESDNNSDEVFAQFTSAIPSNSNQTCAQLYPNVDDGGDNIPNCASSLNSSNDDNNAGGGGIRGFVLPNNFSANISVCISLLNELCNVTSPQTALLVGALLPGMLSFLAPIFWFMCNTDGMTFRHCMPRHNPGEFVYSADVKAKIGALAEKIVLDVTGNIPSILEGELTEVKTEITKLQSEFDKAKKKNNPASSRDNNDDVLINIPPESRLHRSVVEPIGDDEKHPNLRHDPATPLLTNRM